MLTRELLDIWACPSCKGAVTLLDDGTALECLPCGLRYGVRDGIPVLLVDGAEKLP